MKNAAALQAGDRQAACHGFGKQSVNFRQEGLYFDKKRGILYDKNLYDTAARLLRLGRYNGEI